MSRASETVIIGKIGAPYGVKGWVKIVHCVTNFVQRFCKRNTEFSVRIKSAIFKKRPDGGSRRKKPLILCMALFGGRKNCGGLRREMVGEAGNQGIDLSVQARQRLLIHELRKN